MQSNMSSIFKILYLLQLTKLLEINFKSYEAEKLMIKLHYLLSEFISKRKLNVVEFLFSFLLATECLVARKLFSQRTVIFNFISQTSLWYLHGTLTPSSFISSADWWTDEPWAENLICLLPYFRWMASALILFAHKCASILRNILTSHRVAVSFLWPMQITFIINF